LKQLHHFYSLRLIVKTAMKKTIQAIQIALKEKEKLSANALTQVKGGDGCEDKRKGVGGGTNKCTSSDTNSTFDPNSWY
jgi:hypothetical protein